MEWIADHLDWTMDAAAETLARVRSPYPPMAAVLKQRCTGQSVGVAPLDQEPLRIAVA